MSRYIKAFFLVVILTIGCLVGITYLVYIPNNPNHIPSTVYIPSTILFVTPVIETGDDPTPNPTNPTPTQEVLTTLLPTFTPVYPQTPQS